MADIPHLDLFCSLLKGETHALPELGAAEAQDFYDAARRHGIHLLIADRLWQSGVPRGLPQAVRDQLAQSLRSQLAVEELARQELQATLASFADAGLRPLLLKGTALAYTLYRDPVLRPRVDTDLLIESVERGAQGRELLRQLGYERLPLMSGPLVMPQDASVKTDRHGVRHAIDLHWAISNPQVFAQALGYDELWAASVAVPALGAAGRAPSPIHSLAIGCIHRVAHHADEERLIWLFDLHLLVERLADAERDAFVELAVSRQIATVCADALALTARLFVGQGARRLLTALGSRPVSVAEPSARYASRSLRKVDVLLSDFAAAGGWTSRMRLLREHLFPPVEHVRNKYRIRSSALLPLFYVRRVVGGAFAWCRRPAAPFEIK